MQLEADQDAVNVKIYKGDNWTPQLRAPLGQPGINGPRHRGLLQSMADRSAVVAVDGDAATVRQLSVTPVVTHQQLRYFDWVEDNRRKIGQAFGGKLAYIYIPDAGDGGCTKFVRDDPSNGAFQGLRVMMVNEFADSSGDAHAEILAPAKAWFSRDPQLEKAIAVALEAFENIPAPLGGPLSPVYN